MKNNQLLLLPLAISAIVSGTYSTPTVAQGFTLEEVVVTARKREESLQDVPVAVSSFSADDISAVNMTDTRELASYTPSLFIETNSAQSLASAKTTIRGQVQTDSLSTVDPSVGWYLDDVYLARTVGTVASLFDLERIEVLKGPQGTLYGRNTTGGAIKLVTTKAEPSGDVSGYVTAGLGRFGAEKYGGAINIPLVQDMLAVRLVALSDEVKDGFGSQLVTPSPLIATLPFYADNSRLNFEPHRADAGQRKTEMYRVGVTFNPIDDLSILLNYDKNRLYANSLLMNYLGDAPAAGNYIAPSDKFHGGVSNALQEAWASTETASLTVEYEINPDLLTKLVLGWRDLDSSFYSDIDGTPFPLNYFIEPFQQNSEQKSAEWQLGGEALSGAFEWLTGLYYFEESGIDFSKSNGLADFAGRGFVWGTYNATIDRNISRSAFISGTLHLTDAFSINGGVRYTRDTKPVSVQAQALLTDGSTTCRFGAGMPNPDLANCTWHTSSDYEYISWTAGADWKID